MDSTGPIQPQLSKPAEMRVHFYDIRSQYEDLRQPIDRAVLDVLAGGVFVMGPHGEALERDIADLHGVRYGIAVNSGTDALRILLDAAGIGPGDEVITTAFTFVASVETIMQTGATPVFVDIDPATFMIDASKIRAAITPRTKAIMPIHLFGQLANVAEITKIARENGLKVIEDAAQALGSTHNGVAAGKFGIGAGLSFYVTKNLGAAGDGGLILTDDPEIRELCRSIRIHGMGVERYYYDHVGYTSRLDEIQAAILEVKLRSLADWNARRAEIATQYLEALAGVPVTLPIVSPGNHHTWHQFCIRTPRRDEIQRDLKENGIDSMIYYPVPIHFHAPYRHLAEEGSLPETERAAREILSLPIHPHLTDEQVQHVARQLVVSEAALKA